MKFLEEVINELVVSFKAVYGVDVDVNKLLLSPTKKEFDGDFTLVIFPFVKDLRKSPEQIGDEIGKHMVQISSQVQGYNVIKGFLNLSLSDQFWKANLDQIVSTTLYGNLEAKHEKVMVEFSSPNTNKPLHLGHIRNILLGWSCAKILQAAGYEVIKTQIINDRGIAVCKSMLAWSLFGDGKTPESTGIKGDHFVGDYYVLFETKFQEEYGEWQSTAEGQTIFATRADLDQSEAAFFKAYKNDYFNNYSALGKAAKEMLLAWEAGDGPTVSLWKKMNAWVYAGFEETYDKLLVNFDKYYYESDTYLLGKDAVKKGLDLGVFYQKEDSSIWIDLTDAGMDHKLVQRRDGTSVYMTQDIGTAQLRYQDFGATKMIYTVADEQDYHFQVLFEIMKRLKEPFAEGLFHLSYGMVDLPTGKMKSREGTVVDADDLMAEVIAEAKAASDERGEIAEISAEEQQETIRKIGIAALKFFMIKVHPKKRMTFDPKESVDMQGQTGPYIQNAYVRIKSILRRANDGFGDYTTYNELEDQEKVLLTLVMSYPDVVLEAANGYDPSTIANFCYSLAKEFHKFYHDIRILGAETENAKSFRLTLSSVVAKTLQHGMDLLGIEMPEKM
ncbi:MAG: arginine--tRNA ligase [Saprospiraceae bacterium]|nr:arginine--tRNA ligase [Saprospiraceae bacterium]